jgi:hypothetical protein
MRPASPAGSAFPRVLPTHDGTRRLRDGQVVTVDGTAGSVLVEAPASIAVTHEGARRTPRRTRPSSHAITVKEPM